MKPLYPIPYANHNIDNLASILGKWPIYCPICDSFSYISHIDAQNLRESCICHRCKSTNRQRQLAIGILEFLKLKKLKDIFKLDINIYNTETGGALHNLLKTHQNYQSSEYFGPKYKSGDIINNTMNQDLMGLSFKNNIFDLVLSSEVFEHIPDPYKAHTEVHRVLKKEGAHIFTVPFYQTGYTDEKRAFVDSKGKLKHLLPPQYHLDGIRPDEGILVYNIFSIEMLGKLDSIGLKTALYLLHKINLGILGNNCTLFIAVKNS